MLRYPQNMPSLLIDGPSSPETLTPELAALRGEAGAAPEEFFELAQRNAFRALQAQAPNTQRAYASDWRSFVRFCQAHGFPALPASPSAVEAFIEASAVFSSEVPYKYVAAGTPRRNVKTSSLVRAVAAISAVHTWLQWPNPTVHPDVKHTLKINTRGRSAKTPKAPLTWAQIERALATYGDTPEERRSAALLAIAFSTLLRRSELVALQVEDFVPSVNGDDGVMHVRRSKADQAGDGDLRYVTPLARRELERWLSGAGLATGPLFARLNRNQAPLPKALHPNQVALSFKAAARRAGLSEAAVARIAAHSTRIGATHELNDAGATLPQLMRAGGWRSPQMPATYLREADVKTGAMAAWARAARPAMPSAADTSARDAGVTPTGKKG